MSASKLATALNTYIYQRLDTNREERAKNGKPDVFNGYARYSEHIAPKPQPEGLQKGKNLTEAQKAVNRQLRAAFKKTYKSKPSAVKIASTSVIGKMLDQLLKMVCDDIRSVDDLKTVPADKFLAHIDAVVTEKNPASVYHTVYATLKMKAGLSDDADILTTINNLVGGYLSDHPMDSSADGRAEKIIAITKMYSMFLRKLGCIFAFKAWDMRKFVLMNRDLPKKKTAPRKKKSAAKDESDEEDAGETTAAGSDDDDDDEESDDETVAKPAAKKTPKRAPNLYQTITFKDYELSNTLRTLTLNEHHDYSLNADDHIYENLVARLENDVYEANKKFDERAAKKAEKEATEAAGGKTTVVKSSKKKADITDGAIIRQVVACDEIE